MALKKLEQARHALLQIFQAALGRVEGRSVVRAYLQENPGDDQVSLVAVGKAAQAMAMGAVDALGERIVDGLVISKPGHLNRRELAAHRLAGLEGGHPVPDESSLVAGRAMLDYLSHLPAERPLLFLISGGTSSLVEVLPDGLGLDDLQRVNRWLLGSGLAIDRMNRIRKALSRIKGGGLLGYLHGPRVRALMISDVARDDPAVIGSGMLVPDEIEEENLGLPPDLAQLIAGTGPRAESEIVPELHILASLKDARNAAADEARRLGYPAHVNHALISAEAETAGRRMALEMLDAWPGVTIWGGEPSVLLPDDPGRGGRNQHLALAVAGVIEGREDICFLSAGTDGTDGPGEDAGAMVDGGTLGRARREGFDAADTLKRADSGSLLEAAGDLVHTGPTGTNVMDLMIGLKIDIKK